MVAPLREDPVMQEFLAVDGVDCICASRVNFVDIEVSPVEGNF